MDTLTTLALFLQTGQRFLLESRASPAKML
jgi:hypothetical protein